MNPALHNPAGVQAFSRAVASRRAVAAIRLALKTAEISESAKRARVFSISLSAVGAGVSGRAGFGHDNAMRRGVGSTLELRHSLHLVAVHLCRAVHTHALTYILMIAS